MFAAAALTPARATEPAQDESLAYSIGVQSYINGFPMMDLYRTLWETSFDPKRGHDRTVNEFFVFDRLVTSADDWVVTANEDTILLHRSEPTVPPTLAPARGPPLREAATECDADPPAQPIPEFEFDQRIAW